jgi:NCAIR mutase (PurE)-related protein
VGEGLRALLEAVAAGRLGVEEALRRLEDMPFADLGMARLDTLREARTGVPEVVFGEGKRPDQVLAIAQRLHRQHGRVLVTRASPAAVEALRAWRADARCHPAARTVVVDDRPERPAVGRVAVVAAGTSDLPVAEEVAETAAFCGSAVVRVTDVGVAGLHRLLAALPELRSAEVVVVVAGMDGALPAVVTGLVDRPVIAVPTSVGYGVAAGGYAALATMLASCAPGLAVVNIDNGFGAGVLAHRINVRAAGAHQAEDAGDGRRVRA